MIKEIDLLKRTQAGPAPDTKKYKRANDIKPSQTGNSLKSNWTHSDQQSGLHHQLEATACSPTPHPCGTVGMLQHSWVHQTYLYPSHHIDQNRHVSDSSKFTSLGTRRADISTNIRTSWALLPMATEGNHPLPTGTSPTNLRVKITTIIRSHGYKNQLMRTYSIPSFAHILKSFFISLPLFLSFLCS